MLVYKKKIDRLLMLDLLSVRRADHGSSSTERAASRSSVPSFFVRRVTVAVDSRLSDRPEDNNPRLRWLQYVPVTVPPSSTIASKATSPPRTNRDFVFLFFSGIRLRLNETKDRWTDPVQRGPTRRRRAIGGRPTASWLDELDPRTLHLGIDHGWRENQAVSFFSSRNLWSSLCAS